MLPKSKKIQSCSPSGGRCRVPHTSVLPVGIFPNATRGYSNGRIVNSIDQSPAMTHKTNAVRILDQLGVPYEPRAYEVDPDDLAAETVAAKIGLPHGYVFKTLLAQGD